jgi:hypothetical protein
MVIAEKIIYIMIQRYYQFILLLSIAALFPFLAFSQMGHIPELFQKIDNEPKIIQCRNELEVNNVGGHLQGIQWLVKNDVEFSIISGSSSTDAYYAVVKLDHYNEVMSLNILMHKPFKHAGGIQLSEDLLVVAGDWDTKHLDFYRCDQPRLTKNINPFDKVYTIDTEIIGKTGWLDKEWHAYQNINLLKDDDGELYWFGYLLILNVFD